jgi:hypothetical protein
MKHNIIVTTNENDIWKSIEKVRMGTAVRLLGIGRSMCPLLEGGRDYIDLIAVNHDTKLCKNDVVFYKSHDNQYVTHRIYSISEKGYYMMGDGNLSIEPLINRDNIYMKAIGFVRKGKYISIEALRYQIYVFLWMKLYPIRIHLLRLYHRYCKVISVLKKENNMKIKEDFMLRNICEDWIVIPMGERLLDFNGMMKLNQSGSFIWKLLEMKRSREEIISAMLEEYDIPEETAAQEFDTFLQTLKEANILEA